jgi:hypothetical protein
MPNWYQKIALQQDVTHGEVSRDKTPAEEEACHDLSHKECTPHKHPLGQLSDGTKIFLVDGDFVRNNCDSDYVLGGHGFAYQYIPKDEIWLAHAESKLDLIAVLSHEATERYLMKERNYDYEKAHQCANIVEGLVRKRYNPQDHQSSTGKGLS